MKQEPPKEEEKKQLYWPDGTPFVDYAAQTYNYVEELEANFAKFTGAFEELK